MSDYRVSILCDDTHELGEGVTYDPETDTAWWFDIVGCGLYEHHFGRETTVQHALPKMASVLAHIDAGRQLLAMEDGLYLRDIVSGALTLKTPLEADNPVTRSNDGRTHPSGSLWIGTMGKAAEREAGAIYWYDGKQIKRLYDRITVPNAICFSADGKTGYWTDSMRGRLMRVELDPATGVPLGEAEVFVDGRGKVGGMDGAVVDRVGNIWNAVWGGSAVDVYSPDGTLLESISMPAQQVSCPAFCGRDGNTLVVTSAWQGMDEDARLNDPHAGKTFAIKGSFEGRFDSPFKPAGWD